MTTQQETETRILFFASFRELLGVSEVIIQLQDSLSVELLLDQLYAQIPDVKDHLLHRKFLISVNQQLVSEDMLVTPGDEVALFPMVTGG